MNDFDAFADIDVDKLISLSNAQLEQMEGLQEKMADLVGVARDPDGLVTVEYGSEGVRELEIAPKAMRLASGELAERIKAALRDAWQDLQDQLGELMGEAFGEENNPIRFLNDPEAVLNDVKNAEAAYNKTFEDVVGELQNIQRRLDT